MKIDGLIATTGAPLKDALMQEHPWYAMMLRNDMEWPLMRAVTGAFSDDEVKQCFLPRGDFEPPESYAKRVELSQFTGKTSGIASSFAGAVFAAGFETEIPDAELSTWTDNVDGSGMTLADILEVNADEAVTMGLCGFLLDVPSMTEEQAARLKDVPADVRSASGAVPLDVLNALGVERMPRAVKVCAENVMNWSADDNGRLEWVSICQEVSRQATPDAERACRVQWIVMDRTTTAIFEAEYGTRTTSGTIAPEPVTFPLDAALLQPPVFVRSATHNLGMVPFAPYYGGGMRSGPLQSRSLLEGSKRADLSMFNHESWMTFAMYLHNVPMLVLKTGRDVGEIVRDISRALVLDPDKKEEADYKSTPSDSFDISMKAVQSKALEAFRQAGADPTGMFEGSAQPESGTAKALRFRHTEERSLARIAKAAEDCAYDLLEIAARYLAPSSAPPSVRVFTGTVRFPSRFDLAEPGQLAAQYDRMAKYIDSPRWHREMLKRIAMATVGDMPREVRDEIEAEIEGQDVSQSEPEMQDESAAAGLGSR